MTHAECQEQLLDLAYGELEAPRAAEVELHLASCAECRSERALLDGTRQAAAPLREEEQPSQGFDERILAAAHAEASLRADGTPGPVIEATATTRAAGIEAAHIDPLNAVVRSAPRAPRRRWALRVALGGSAAAAAALALLVSSSQRRSQMEPQSEQAAEKFAIHVRAPQQIPEPAAPTPGLSDAPAPGAAGAGASGGAQPAPLAGAVAPSSAAVPTQGAPPAAPALDARRKDATRHAGQEAQSQKNLARVEREEGGGGDVSNPVPPASKAEAVFGGSAKPEAGTSTPARPEAKAQRAAGPPAGVVASAAPAPQFAKAPSEAGDPDPAQLEQQAQKARRDGNYALAAGLYRKAAAQHAALKPDPAAAAWDLAHAVECLSSVSQFDEARKVADELARLYPAETGAASATRRALRSAQTAPMDDGQSPRR